MEKIHIKPHHFVDIICSFGQGKREFQPHPFGHAVHTISQLLLKNPKCEIQLELGADDICLPCIHNIKDKCSDTIDTSYRPKAPKLKLDWNLLIDLRWCEHLGNKQGDVLTTGEICEKIEGKIQYLYDIYREIPKDKTDQRNVNLIKGLDFFKYLIK